MECVLRIHRAILRPTSDSVLRLRYDWSHKYAPNRVRVETPAFSGSGVKMNVATLTPHDCRGKYRVRGSLSFVKLDLLSRITIFFFFFFWPQDRKEDAPAAPARQTRGVVVLPLYSSGDLLPTYLSSSSSLRSVTGANVTHKTPYTHLSSSIFLIIEFANNDEIFVEKIIFMFLI